MIKFEDVSIQYIKEFSTLYNFSCTINSNTLFVGDFFEGTNSIMRLLSKIDREYSGNIFVDEMNLKTIKDEDLQIAHVPENPILFKNKTLFKNLYYPLKIRKFSKLNSIKIINDFFNSVSCNLEDFKNFDLKTLNKTKVKNLTLSEQKITSLIRAAIRKPKYILLENFFENLDEKYHPLAIAILDEIKKNSLLVACEKNANNQTWFNDFKILNLTQK